MTRSQRLGLLKARIGSSAEWITRTFMLKIGRCVAQAFAQCAHLSPEALASVPSEQARPASQNDRGYRNDCIFRESGANRRAYRGSSDSGCNPAFREPKQCETSRAAHKTGV